MTVQVKLLKSSALQITDNTVIELDYMNYEGNQYRIPINS